MNKDFFKKNRLKLLMELANGSILIMFAGKAPKKSNDYNYRFTPNRNFYYLCGIDEEYINLVVIKDKSGNIDERIYIRQHDEKRSKWIGKSISVDEAKKISGIDDIRYIDDFNSDLNSLISTKNLTHIYLDLEKDSYEDNLTPTGHFAKDLKERYSQVSVHNVYPKLCILRMCKEKEEIKEIKVAIEKTRLGIEAMMKSARPSIMEYQLESYFDFELKNNGVKDFSFPSIIASGQNGTVLHYEDNNCEIEDNSLVLCDVGAAWNYYHGDITRTFPINGKFTEKQKQIYNVVLNAELETIKALGPGHTFISINEVTKKALAEGLIELGIMKDESELSNYYYHQVSHHLGLDTHDVEDYDAPFEEGMVLTVEPGLYLSEEGIGIRIEDDVIITKDGCKVLSDGIIKTIEDIEEFMKNAKK
ncbi:aminopeptidase P family protein [Clostridium sp. UBA1056]|uniref:aminopeptidase P family protein n=1 Tax=unclassified Clostridium TaxID=2614128 RepID=UPI0032179A2A